MDNASVAELEQHATALRSRLLNIAGEVRALLAEDLPRFVERELKRAFVSEPEFAASMSDETLRQLKKDVTGVAASKTAEVVEALEDESLWFTHQLPEDPRASLAENAALWSVVNRISGAVEELLSKYGFPPGEEPISYRPPTWFVGRRYLPTLSEKYWSLLRELSEIETQARSIRSEASRSELARRWDES